MNEILNEINKSLEVALFKKVDLLLIILQSMSMSMLEGNWAIRKYIILDTKLERCIFATFLTSTTIQDDDKRERSYVHHAIL